MSIIRQLVRNIIETKFEAFDPETVKQAKNRIIDVMGCLIAGTRARDWAMMVDLVREWGGKWESTILPYGDRVPACNAAMANSILASAFDFDPLESYVEGVYFRNHTSSTTVATALAVAEQKGKVGKELLTAIILGDDVASRVVAASNFSRASGWSSIGTVGIFGAAATAGRLWGLDEHQMVNAFGIVLDQVAGSIGGNRERTHGFKLQHGLASRNGILSVELASRGWTGVKEPWLGRYGYFTLYCQTPQTEVLTRELGRKFYADATFKRYPCALNNQAANDCALELANRHDIKTDDVDEITVEASPRTVRVDAPSFEIGEVPQISAGFSLQYNVANALLRKNVRLEHFTEAFIKDPKVIKLAKKVKPVVANTLPEDSLAVSMKVRMKGGEEFSAFVDLPRGGPEKSLTREKIKDKFRTNVAFSKIVAPERAETALSMLEGLETVDDIGEIIRLLSTRKMS